MQVISNGLERGAPQLFRTGTNYVPSVSSVAAAPHILLEPAKQFASVIEGFSIGMIPCYILQIGKSIKSLIDDPPYKKINASLDIITSVKEIGEGIVAFLEYLEGLRAISESAISWSGPFSLVMTIFSVASIARNVKICKETYTLLEEFDEIVRLTRAKGKPTQNSLHEVLRWIENKQREDADFLDDFLNVKEESFVEALVARERCIDEKIASSNPQEQEEAEQLLATTIKSLRGRVQKNITESVVSIVASVVNMIGSILIFCCPLNPVGWSLVGISGLIDGGRVIYHKVTEYQSAQEIGMRRSYLEWILC